MPLLDMDMEYSYHIILMGFIKSTDHRPIDHLLTDQSTQRPPTHQPTDRKFTDPLTRFYFKNLIIKKYLFCRIQTQLGKYKTILRSI